MNGNNRTLYRIIDATFRSRWLVLISFSAVMLGAAGVMRLVGDKYTATAAVRIVSDETASSMGIAPADSKVWITPGQQNANRFEDLLNDNQPGGFLYLALKDAALDRPIKLEPSAKDPRCQALYKGLFAKTDSDTMFSISLTWDNPRECERIVQALRNEYIEQVGAGRQAQSVATERFLQGQLSQYEVRMLKAEEVLTRYKQANAGRLPEAEASLNDQLARLKAQLDDLKISSQDNELKRQALLQRLAQVPPTIKEQTFEADSGGAQGEPAAAEDPVARQIADLQKQRDDALKLYMPTSMQVREIDEKIAALQANRHEPAKPLRAEPPRPPRVRQTKITENPEYSSLMQQLTAAKIADKTQQAQMLVLQHQISAYEAQMQKMPAAQRELAEKTRDYTVLTAEYDKLAERREQAQIKASLDKVTARSTFSPIGTIAAQSTMSGKKLAMMLGGGLVFGLLFAGLVVFVREWTDPTLRYEEDVAKDLGTRLLVSFPDAKERQPALSSGGRMGLSPPSGGTGPSPKRLPGRQVPQSWIPDLAMRSSEADN